jgi:beta-galactosidase
MKATAAVLSILFLCAGLYAAGQAGSTQTLDWFGPGAASIWKPVHCDLENRQLELQATFWKGYINTGFEADRLPVSDWSRWKTLRFEVENPYPEPFSVYVRLSNRADHPAGETFTGGTFDGLVIGPGRNTVEIGLEEMKSAEEHPVDPAKIAYAGIFLQPLFLRDGMDLRLTQDRTLRLSGLQFSASPATRQKQPYGDLLFRETDPSLAARRQEVEQALAQLQAAIGEAKGRGLETGYAEIYPFLAQIAFHSRLVPFWQDRVREQGLALETLIHGLQEALRQLRGTIAGTVPARTVPAVPDYGSLAIRDGYFRLKDVPVLLFGMLYNRSGSLLRWFANSETDYGTQLVAGGTRHDVERQPIWQAYQQYPDTHRVGWEQSGHIIRDRGSWEVLGPPVVVCLESPRSREAVSAMIERFEKSHANDREHLVQNLGYEYTYVCYCDYTRQMWRDWLRGRYGAVDKANGVWGTRYADFSQAPMPRPEQAASNRALWFDWSTFNLRRFMDQIRWTRDQIRRWEPSKPLTVGSPFYAFSPSFWTAVDEEELADSGVTGVVLEENYELDTLMPEYLHALAGSKPVMDFEYHGEAHQILPSFLHGDSAISMWWWNDRKRWTPNEPINEWPSSFPQSYTIPLGDIGRTMRDALDLRRLSREISALGSAPRPVALLYSKTSMLQHIPAESAETGTFPYLTELRRLYNASQSAGVYVGVTTEKKILGGDLGRLKMLVLPGAQFVPDDVAGTILEWVKGGGNLIVSPDSLLADEYARPKDRLTALGARLVRIEPARLKRGERYVTEYNLSDLPRMTFTASGRQLQAAGTRQILESSPQNVMAKFGDGNPAVLRVPYGRGTVYWLAAPLESGSWSSFFGLAAENAGLRPALKVSPEVEYRVVGLDGRRIAYLYNNSGRDLQVTLEPAFSFDRIIDRRTETRLEGRTLPLPARATALVEFR